MNAIKKFAIGGSTIEDFAKNTYIKNNITNKLKETIKNLKTEYFNLGKTNDFTSEELMKNNEIIINDTNLNIVQDLLNLIDAALIHGLKEKLSFSKVLSPLKISSNLNKSFSSLPVKDYTSQDFWPIIVILSHNQLSLNLKTLNNIYTDIGRCRAWVRLALNDNFFCSYLKVLINDISLLHGFYRPLAYLRDKEHIELFILFLGFLENFTFDLNYDYYSLNSWDESSLLLSGYNIKFNDLQNNEENTLEPILPAIDALKILEDYKENTSNLEKDEKDKKLLESEKQSVQVYLDEENQLYNNINTEIIENLPIPGNSIQIKTGWSTSPQQSLQIDAKNDFKNNILHINTKSSIEIINEKRIENLKLTTTNTSQCDDIFDNCSYDNLLASYSSKNILCSTPEIKNIYMPTNLLEKKNEIITKKKVNNPVNSFQNPAYNSKYNNNRNLTDFEVISQSLVLYNDSEILEFLSKYSKIQPEFGLDEQDYKCPTCGRPIGMVYGKSRLCKYDGFNYCLECNKDEKSLIPAKVIHNWDFNKYTVSKENKVKLDLLENEPVIDLKVVNPLLYQYNEIMKECLELRTQLFYLHGYLFTCQESIALDLRKQVWPSEHLFEHIHLYSLNDLVQAQSGILSTKLRKSIQLAKKHVILCTLCSQKGFICEICRSPNVIYPFEINNTYRCDTCKSVFHLNCISVSNTGNLNKQSKTSITKPKQKPCPRCVRIKFREKIN